MYKGGLREDIETIVRALPRPKMNGSLIVKRRNLWLIVQEYGDADGVILLNTVTNHEGPIPYDSVREFRKPDMLILRAQVCLGRDGEFSIDPISDGLDSEMEVEMEEVLPERLAFAQKQLSKLTEDEIKLLTQLLIREKMTAGEIQEFCRSIGISDGNNFLSFMMLKTSLIEKDDPHKVSFTAWLKPGFVPILENLLLHSQRNKRTILPQPASPSATESGDS
jgi:hypothetical protein